MYSYLPLLLLLASVSGFKNFRYNKIKNYNLPKNQNDINYIEKAYVYDYVFDEYIYIDKKIRKIFNNQKLNK